MGDPLFPAAGPEMTVHSSVVKVLCFLLGRRLTQRLLNPLRAETRRYHSSSHFLDEPFTEPRLFKGLAL
jgi:hypothetical protein